MNSMPSFNLLPQTGKASPLNPAQWRSPSIGALVLSMIVALSVGLSSAQDKSAGKQISMHNAVVATPVSATAETAPVTQDLDTGVQTFLKAFVAAMNAHDPEAFFRLQAEDCATVNRAGRFFRDRASLKIQIERLLKQLFKDYQFPPFRILHQRSLTPELVILQAAWQNPSLEPPPAPPVSDMVVTFLLKKSGSVWLAEEVDSHNVEGLPAVPGETQVFPSAGATKP